MGTYVVIGVIAALVLFVGKARMRRFPNPADLDMLIGTLGKRYVGELWDENFAALTAEQIQNADRLIAYAERVLDRQISKVQGILPFNAIVLAVISFERDRMPDTLALALPQSLIDAVRGLPPAAMHALEIATSYDVRVLGLLIMTMLGLALSSLLCLSLFSVKWGPIRHYGSFWHELSSTLGTIRKRSRRIEWATVISQACLIVSVVLVAAAELNGAIKREAPLVPASMPAPAIALALTR